MPPLRHLALTLVCVAGLSACGGGAVPDAGPTGPGLFEQGLISDLDPLDGTPDYFDSVRETLISSTSANLPSGTARYDGFYLAARSNDLSANPSETEIARAPNSARGDAALSVDFGAGSARLDLTGRLTNVSIDGSIIAFSGGVVVQDAGGRHQFDGLAYGDASDVFLGQAVIDPGTSDAVTASFAVEQSAP